MMAERNEELPSTSFVVIAPFDPDWPTKAAQAPTFRAEVARSRGKLVARLIIDMPFDEALERFIGTNPTEALAVARREKARTRKAAASSPNVVTLKAKREQKRNGKLKPEPCA